MHPKTISPVFLDVLRGIPILYILNLLLNFGKERLNNTKLTKRQRQTKAEELGPPWLHGLAEMVFHVKIFALAPTIVCECGHHIIEGLRGGSRQF
jgi:hypothetical protein